ncbi:hypothetical protein BAE44_0009512 [Dichanthelium oligosanthes]|uniref:Gnk2-homologous domain-containing protein n=1 Tax=Dichanthelium oligosanthes TaxID=888268 RepID=A0A1E5VWI6_9POAL|nr:hypothetical protein BAE44_0009512 [Dichanthelium oligosanthes]
MKNSSLLLSLFVLVAAASPLAAAWSRSPVSCGGDGRYTANSTYEANLHRLAAVLPAEASASHRRYGYRAFGYWPNRLQVEWSCYSGDCAVCIADAFKQVERECPFYREASFFGANCTLRLGEYRIFGSDLLEGNIVTRNMSFTMVFQAIGFAWLFFLLLQDWREKKRGSLM